jgi:hypothetical protein
MHEDGLKHPQMPRSVFATIRLCIRLIPNSEELGIAGNYSAISIYTLIQFTVTHALVFSAFTCRILATDS